MSEVAFKQKVSGYLDYLLSQGGSDLHLSTGNIPYIKVDNSLEPLREEPVISESNLKSILKDFLNEGQMEKLEIKRQVDFSLEKKNGNRFRVNVFYTQGKLSFCFRAIDQKIKELKDLDLPESLYDFMNKPQGLFLVVGPNGHGKSTTLASLIEYVNVNQKKHIITIEDPIEYVYSNKKSLIEQRELHLDTLSFSGALESCFRQDTDVVMIGEMRNLETISMAITAAETGQLVVGTLHTNDSVQTIDRIIDVFPPNQQNQIRQQLSNFLIGVLSQRLVKKIGGGRIPAVEMLINNTAIANLIRSGQNQQIKSFLENSREEGMFTLDYYFANLIKKGLITWEEAEKYSSSPEDLKSLIKNI